MMPVSDPEASCAVLIGASQYQTLDALPAVENNIRRFAALLTDTGLWGLPPERVTAMLNPGSRDDVLDALSAAALEATDTLLVYYAGHGLLDDENSALHLALPDGASDRLHRTIRYDDLRREVVRNSRARSKIVILDCCFSGSAMEGTMGGSDLADRARLDGTYLMTATAETVLALAKPGEVYTAFTGELISVVEQGVPDGPDLLDMGTLYFRVRTALEAKNRPVPQERARNDGRAITLFRNRYGTQPKSEPAAFAWTPSDPPSGLEYLLRRPPRELAAAVMDLRNDNQDDRADRLLTAAAGRRPPQEVASMTSLLHSTGRDEDAGAVLHEVVHRSPADVVVVIDVLREVGDPADAVRVLAAAARQPVTAVAALAAALHHAGHTDDVVGLLDAAAGQNPSTATVIGLVAALWSAGLAKEIDRLLDAAAAQLPGAQMLELADALRTVGREDAARLLYERARDYIAGLDGTRIAGVVRELQRVGETDEAHLLLTSAVQRRATIPQIMELAHALWSAEHDEGIVQSLIIQAASQYEVDGVLTLADELWNAGRDAVAVGLYEQCAHKGGWEALLAVVDALRDRGRPLDAYCLLDTAADLPIEQMGVILAGLKQAGRDPEISRLLGVLATLPAKPLAGFLRQQLPEQDGQPDLPLLDRLIRAVAQHGPERFGELYLALDASAPRDTGPDPVISRMTPQLSPNAAALVYLALRANRGNSRPEQKFFTSFTNSLPDPSAIEFVVAIRNTALSPRDTATLVRALSRLVHQEPAHACTLIYALRSASANDLGIRSWLDWFWQMPPNDIVALIKALRAGPHRDEADHLIARIAISLDAPDGLPELKITELATALRESDQTDDLNRLLKELDMRPDGLKLTTKLRRANQRPRRMPKQDVAPAQPKTRWWQRADNIQRETE